MNIMKSVKKDTIVFDGNDCFEKMVVWLSSLKGEPSKVKQTVEYSLQLTAHNRSGFDTWIFLII